MKQDAGLKSASPMQKDWGARSTLDARVSKAGRQLKSSLLNVHGATP